ncbi:NAD(P)/FAD-dependent oxidoreductase [Ktedonosporobacter rubrisoli]|uniref:NAD(P)/FAD-dependent oxidoreductase n=1 Tax=Ktedonosporobacter rubrisoli TaxID=2509675 RepID=A0A4P6JNU4_KTERU|nr:NAD(P)/FAD-dependent oxidoreductase [Ktedonosporobacter rubrisoli]QBD76406.1 NAD(P)/FAD-dependent oxidoreductase [Ktedonosporobacter rubrisoli]
MFHAFAGKKRSLHFRRLILPDESSTSSASPLHIHIAIVGAGFSGLGMAIRLKQQRQEDFIILEQAADIGGTWRDNTYPGCACDIPSHLYSYSFALNPHWSRKYSPQHEIRDYLRRCARRFGILPHIWWKSELQHAAWHEEERRWHITTSRGKCTADILILGQGPLQEPSLPAIAGIESFEGCLFHSAQWRHDYDLSGKRVAVIGTGASAIQFVPHIQPQVSRLLLFQRTPPWIVPRLDQAIPAWQQRLFRLLPLTQRFVRTRIYWRNELTALGLVYRQEILEKAMRFARLYLEAQVADPELRAKLTPHYTIGCKRILLSDDFYPAVSQTNVDVITESISEVRAHSILTADGSEHEIDTLICATGFQVADTRLPYCIYGCDGRTLAQHWQMGRSAYLGTTVAEFPNLFLLIGPNTGLGHNSMVFMIESQITYILHCLHLMEQRHLQAVELRPTIQETFNTALQQRMRGTVWMSGCSSWYLDSGSGRNSTLWPGFTFEFWLKTRRFDPQHYILQPRPAAVQRQDTVAP